MNLLILSTELWDAKRQARKELLYKAMLETGKIESLLYIEPMVLWWRRNDVPARELTISEHVRVCRWHCPLPGDRNAWIRGFNRKWQARRIASLLNSAPYTGIFYHPVNWLVARQLRERVRWFFDWTEDWGVYQNSEQMSQLQQLAIRNAYGVITVCETLFERACEIRGSRHHVLLLPNATALDAGEHEYEEPQELAALAHPRIGLMGHVGPWMDVDLIAALAAARPKWQWFILGDAQGRARTLLSGHGNVHLLGIHPYEQLPAFMVHADLLVAPYNSSAQGDSSKLYDYLTSGKPVISSRLDTAVRLAGGVTIADGREEWLSAIETALKEDDDEAAHTRRSLAADNRWVLRSRQLIEWLEAR